MNENIVPEKLYYLRMLNDNLLKYDESQFVVKNVRISPSGVLEADRVFGNVQFVIKVFYSGEFYLNELSPNEVEDFYTPECDHDHDTDEE